MDKIIRDIVHGYVSVDTFFGKLVNTSHFQRLRHIRQLTSQYVYPSANHTRFEHSLGVYHLARLYVENLKMELHNQEQDENTYDKLMLNVSIAALLHDVGHAPMSHLGEIYFNSDKIKIKLKPLCDQNDIAFSIFERGAAHELMSCYILLRYYVDLIKREIANSDDCKYRKSDIDFEWICRCIVGSKYHDTNSWVKNIGIEIINSDTIDVDKLDYIIRDSHMTGISVPSIDVGRLFRSLIIHPENKVVVFGKQAITVVQNIIDARDCLYMLVYNHHTSVYSDFLQEYYIRHLILSFQKNGKRNDYLKPYDFFSCYAIGKSLVTDNELINLFKKYYTDKNSNVSLYTQTLTNQLFRRDFLQPLWKNLYEFNIFLETKICDEFLINDIKDKLSNGNNRIFRRYVVNEVRRDLTLGWGEIFIAPRSNKFAKGRNKSFYIYCGETMGMKDIGSLLPQKAYYEKFPDRFFYVYVNKNKKEVIEEKFIEVLKKVIPEEQDISEKSEEIEWLKK